MLGIGLILFLIVLLWAIHGPLAELLLDGFHLRGVYQGNDLVREVALTFDDGPHPVYTPLLLELLDQHNVQATFFLVGERAEKYPELVRAIHEHGHIIGSHTYHHRNAWFITPRQLEHELIRTKNVIEQITKTPVTLYRPPWGRLTVATPRITQRLGQVPVLWTYAARDWRHDVSATDIALVVANHLQNGAVVLLHDSGGAADAPLHTLAALKVLLPRIADIGFSCNANPILRAAEHIVDPPAPFPRRMQRIIHPLWMQWERLFDRIYVVYPMSRLFRLSIVAWRFGTRTLSGIQGVESPLTYVAATTSLGAGDPSSFTPATRINDGDAMAELHLQNGALQQLVKITSPEKMAIRGLKELRDSMHGVARALVYDDRFRHAKGVFGMTLMHRGVEKLGFHVEEIEQTLGNRWVSMLLVWIMVLYHPEGRKRLHKGHGDMHPKLLWMSREELLRRYFEGPLPEHVASLEELFSTQA